LLKEYYSNQEAIMKSKTFGKKLTLNKETIADLKIGKMKDVQGGKDAPYKSLLYEITGCCPTECTCGTGDPLCACVSR
jgi:hypothetical protein